MAENLELALFAEDDAGGIRLVGRLTDPDIVQDARTRLAAQRRAELARLEADPEGPCLRAVPRPEPEGGAG